MIDTIALSIPSDRFRVLDHNLFSPSTLNLFEPPYYKLGGRGNFNCSQNPTPEAVRNGIYMPRLTMTKRMTGGGLQVYLRVEFSAPKLIFGNNFDELTDSDLVNVISILEIKLRRMGISIDPSSLESASVSAIHFSKNIALKDGSTPLHYINKLRQADTSMWLDVNQTDYRNGGYSYKWHCNSYELSFYDKIHDLKMAKMSDKRAEEKDNYVQLDLFQLVQKQTPFEVLRIEVRLNKRQKIKQLVQDLGLGTDCSLKELFCQKVSQSILTQSLRVLESKRPKLLEHQGSQKDLLTQLLIANPKITPVKALAFVGFKGATQELTTRELRLLFPGSGQRNWYRFQKELTGLKIAPLPNVFSVLHQQIQTYRPLKLIEVNKVLN